MPALIPLEYGLLTLTLAVALVTDLRGRRIPDVLTYPAMLLALGLRAWLEGLGGEITLGVFSGAVGLVAAGGWFGLFAISGKGMGWGDVKLAAVVGACLGVPLVLSALIFISLVGALQAVVSLLWNGGLGETLRGVLAKRSGDAVTPRQQIPYAVAIALGSLWAMWWQG